jgi:hypothetical protein
MQSDVKMANRMENIDRNGVMPCFLDDLVPQCTEVVLQTWKSIVYGNVKELNFGKLVQNVPKEFKETEVAKGFQVASNLN